MPFFVMLVAAIQIFLLIFIITLAARFVAAHESIASSMDRSVRERDAPDRLPE